MKTLSLLILSFLALDSAQAANYSPIVRSFHSVRTAGMGDVRYTTGLYEENFFANPARMTENPSNRFQLPKISVEVGSAALSTLGDLTKSGSNLSAVSGAVGKPVSARFQMILPAYYSNQFTSDAWALGVGLNIAASTTAVVSQTGTIDPLTMVNVGPAFTIARRLLEEDRLSVGGTLHTEFRGSSNSINLQDFLAGRDLLDAVKGGGGLGLDFDIGTTFRPHWNLGGFEYELGFAVNNLLNGMYKNLGTDLITEWSGAPTASHRSYNFGVSATHKDIGPLSHLIFALEVTDLGNNPNGSFFRLLHLGSEARWRTLALRAGINQGYLTAGLGLDLRFFSLNLATYGEEMGLNAGTLEDRRYALEFGFTSKQSLDDFLNGLMTPIRAVGVIFSSPKLLLWSILPIAVTVVVLSLLFYALLAGVWTWAISRFTGYFASWSGYLAVLAEILVALVFVYVSAFTLSTLTSLFASPFNDVLAESTEKALGVKDVPPTTLGRLIRVFFLDLRKTVITLSLGLAIALFMLIPVVGLVGLLGTSLLNTFTFVTYPQSRRETGVRESIRWIRRHWAASLGFGFTLIFLFAIPVINLFAIPVAVVGGTLLWVERR